MLGLRTVIVVLRDLVVVLLGVAELASLAALGTWKMYKLSTR